MASAAVLPTGSAKQHPLPPLQGSAEAENTTEGRGGGAAEGPGTEDTARQARHRKRRHKEHKRTKVCLHVADKEGHVPGPQAGRLGRPWRPAACGQSPCLLWSHCLGAQRLWCLVLRLLTGHLPCMASKTLTARLLGLAQPSRPVNAV